MMVNTPAFGEAAALVRERMPRLGVGLHFNLLTGRPLTNAASLVDRATGEFLSLAALARRAALGRVSASDVRSECDAQLAALKKQRIAITHLDSHRHTHALPGILAPVLASARAAGVRVVRRPLDAIVKQPVTSAKMLLLHAAWRAASANLGDDDHELLARSPNFRGIALQGAPDVKARLLALLDALPEGNTEIMLHPGYDDAVLAAQDPYRTEREREIAALTSAEVRERLERGDIRLVRFDQLSHKAP
jgi:chitin disaccharide deacetylase